MYHRFVADELSSVTNYRPIPLCLRCYTRPPSMVIRNVQCARTSLAEIVAACVIMKNALDH